MKTDKSSAKDKMKEFCNSLLFILASLIVVVMFFSGCASNDRIDQKPWNSPADWEQNTFGIPY